MKKNNLILLCVVIFGVTLVFIATFLILNEVKSAKEFCNSINGTYSFWTNLKHECNGKPFFQYTSFFFEKYWDFTPRDNFNITLPK